MWSRHFDYLFYVDLEASMADPNAQNALANLKVCSHGLEVTKIAVTQFSILSFHGQEFATFLRVLGSYPTDVSEA